MSLVCDSSRCLRGSTVRTAAFLERSHSPYEAHRRRAASRTRCTIPGRRVSRIVLASCVVRPGLVDVERARRAVGACVPARHGEHMHMQHVQVHVSARYAWWARCACEC